jgi:dimethylaniline monooxygenase (N-oxide forming)
MSDPRVSLPSRTAVLVIGGGPSGIVALKYALETLQYEPGEEPVLVESEPELGGTFR